MSFMSFWKHLTRRRRISFYDSQHAMRAAIASLGPIDLTRLSDDELRRIVAEEPDSMRGDAARRHLAWRAYCDPASGPDMPAAN
ncbi:hypothetical protein F2P47_01115 [Parvibaculum sedimenti]|uniref:Uncharacterized protein n=2 Tax=Parvibaculum sedimenti TaxID=2608632 RepID=A0A6N6VM31_9HYPH|nr:hypothetical protein [Parvibaculum sedimenti]KAB7742763.1 hypothetical protein F2P47_01115 [Parvibaculum sedimenti]